MKIDPKTESNGNHNIEIFERFIESPGIRNAYNRESWHQSNLSFENYLFMQLDDYQETLKKFQPSKQKDQYSPHLNSAFQYAQKVVPALTQSIKKSLGLYMNGNPAAAFESLREGLDVANKKLKEEFYREGLFSLLADEWASRNRPLLPKTEKLASVPLFKIRVCDDPMQIQTRGDIFHIPFEMRHIVASHRFSIPGSPSLYLGSSLYVCWEELNRPSLSHPFEGVILFA